MTDLRRPCRPTGHRSARLGPGPVMWAAIVASTALFVLLTGLGWGGAAASLAGGLLLLACVAVCIWAALQGRAAEREVDRAVSRIGRIRRGQSPEDH